jgi:DNA-binding PadR family transcriptional regulator
MPFVDLEPAGLCGLYRECIVARMSVPHVLLGLLEQGPRHGYELKREFDGRFAAGRPLGFGQVYSTLARLLRNGLVHVDAIEPGGGPERKRYAITDLGVTDLDQWLGRPEPPEPHLQTVLFFKVALALLSGRPATVFLDVQRAAHLQRMRELTALKAGGDLSATLVADYALFHLEADLRWLELTAQRLDGLAEELRG